MSKLDWPAEQPFLVNVLLLLVEILVAVMLVSLILVAIIWCWYVIKDAFKSWRGR